MYVCMYVRMDGWMDGWIYNTQDYIHYHPQWTIFVIYMYLMNQSYSSTHESTVPNRTIDIFDI